MRFHNPSTSRVKRIYIVEFTPAQVVLWIAIAVLLAAGCFWLGTRLSPGRTTGPVQLQEDALPEEPAPEETDVDLDVPDVSLHPPYSRAHEEPVSAIAVSSDGAFLATTSWDTTIKVWAIDTGERVNKCFLKDIIWHALALSPGGHFAACMKPFELMKAFGVEPGIELMQVWDLEKQEMVLERDRGVNACTFSPDGEYLALLDESNLHLYSTRTWRLVELFPVLEEGATPFSHPSLGFGTKQGEITVLDLERRVTINIGDGTRTVLQAGELSGEVIEAALSPQEPFLAAFINEQGCFVRRFDTGQVLESVSTEEIPLGPMVLTPDGRYLAVGNPEGGIDLMTIPGFHHIQRFTCEVDGLAALPDSKHLIAFGMYHVILFSIEGAPLIRYFSDEINPEYYRIREGEENTSY